MMTTKVAGGVAIAFSIGALLCVFMFIPLLWQKMSAIQSKLQMEMDEFNVIAEDAWKEIMVIRHEKPKTRAARQASGTCRKHLCEISQAIDKITVSFFRM